MLTAYTNAEDTFELTEAVGHAMAQWRSASPTADSSADLAPSLLELLQLLGDPGSPEPSESEGELAQRYEQRLVRWLTPHLRLIQKQQARTAKLLAVEPPKLTLDQAPVAMALCDITGYVRWANRSMEALLLGMPAASLRQLVDLDTSRPACHALRIGDRTHELIALNVPALGPTNVALLAKPGSVKAVCPATARARLADQTVQIDGLRVGYNEYGPAEGQPVLFMHNWSGSRLQVPLDNDCLQTHGIRLIVPDQPGHGLSSPLPNPKGQDALTQWPRLVEQLADALGLTQFAIMGHCSGAIQALACAKALPRRITRVVLISPFAPIRNLADMASLQASGRLMHNQSGKLPDVKLPLMQLWLGQMRQQVGQCRDHFLVDLALRDHAITASAAQQAQHTRSFVEAIHQSDEAPLSGLRLIASDWSRLLDIRQPVTIWHGDEDRTVPPSHGQRLVHTLPNAKLRHVPGFGHDLYYQHWPEIIRALGDSLSPR
ncbi:MAG: alpha/beta hydrolase [Burkholderiales bacterium]|nr:alpha/beta hydrolase [Burkholderiales bacterium]